MGRYAIGCRATVERRNISGSPKPLSSEKPGKRALPSLTVRNHTIILIRTLSLSFSVLFQPSTRPYQNPVFIALGESRKFIPSILKNSSGKGFEIVLEEWATQKEERPPLPDNVSFSSVLTTNGKPNLPEDSIDAVFFLDSYHLLFHEKTLLAELYEKLSPSGCVYILDRKAKEKSLSRREASHRRQIHPDTVKQEMAAAGFSFWFRGPQIAPDRFLLVFGKTKQKGTVEKVRSDSPKKEIWKVPNENLIFCFKKKDGKYFLANYLL